MARYRAEGAGGLRTDPRSPSASRPHQSGAGEAICALRRLRFTGAQIAEILGMPTATVSAVLRRHGMGRLGRLGMEPARRDERARPGELIHVDVKRLGRISGGAGKAVTGRRHYTPTHTDRRRRATQELRLGVRARGDR